MADMSEQGLIERLLAEHRNGSNRAPSPLSELNRQQLCAALGISESTVRRLEQAGLPFTPVGKRAKRYNLDECKTWLKENNSCPPGMTRTVASTSALWLAGKEFTESCRKVRVRVMPSE